MIEKKAPNFPRAEELYVKTYPPKPNLVDVGGLVLSMPTMPPESEMLNYKLKQKNQKFQTRALPKDIRYWSGVEIDEYVKAEWHRRINGYWVLVNGNPIYIPPGADAFFNYWVCEYGGLPEFRIEAVEFFQQWYLGVVPDPDCFGLVDIKCRRLGETEKILFIIWEDSTRFANSKAGMQHINEKDCGKNFERLVLANFKMPFFYKPQYKGTEKPTKVLHFTKPMVNIGMASALKKAEDGASAEEEEDFLESKIDYEATKTGAYDGQRLNLWYGDEFFKIKSYRMDPREQISNIKKVVSLNNEKKIVGKMFIASTVEDMEDGETVALASELWDDSDQAKKNANNRTVSGFYRVFRGYKLAAAVDEYGYHKADEAELFRNTLLSTCLENNNFKEALSITRKQPSCIEDALITPPQDCVLFPELCNIRLNQLRNGVNRYMIKEPKKIVEGDLIWKDGKIGNDVIFVPRAGGKWHISGRPKFPNARKQNRINVKEKGVHSPGASHMYKIGLDPYDSDETEQKGSDGAFTVKITYLPEYENPDLDYDENGNIINIEDAWTNQFVCDYQFREKNPYTFYEDALKTAIYYGAKLYIESDKPGIIVWIKNQGFSSYLQTEASSPSDTVEQRRRKSKKIGTKATTDKINRYVEALVGYVGTMIWATHHPRIITQWRSFTKAKRTKFDLAVATGWTLVAEEGDSHVTHSSDRDDAGWGTAKLFTFQNQ